MSSIDGHHVQVRIVQMAACAECKVASACHASERKEKTIDVYNADTRRLSLGDKVSVVVSHQSATRALLLGFGLPLALMLVVLTATQLVGMGEGTAALLMLGSLIPYYIILWCTRRRIANKLTFSIEQITK